MTPENPQNPGNGKFKIWWAHKYPLTKGVTFMLNAGYRLLWTGLVIGRLGIGVMWRQKEPPR